MALIATLEVAVQPLLPVAVTVYVPAVVTLGAPLVHVKPEPLGVSVTVGLAHVNSVEVKPTLTTGSAVFCVIVKDDTLVQPVLVTVTVYVPGAVTVLVAPVPGIDHA